MRSSQELSEFSFLSRRRFLKLFLGGGSALLMGGGIGLFALRGSAPVKQGLRILSAHEYQTFTALAQVHVPRGGPFELGAEDFDLGVWLDVFLCDEPVANIEDLKNALFLFEFGPVFFERRLCTFSNLDKQEQLEHWNSWMTSSSEIRRMAATALRKLLSFAFYSQPQVASHIGYSMRNFWD